MRPLFSTLEPHLVITPESPVHSASVFVSTNAHWSNWFRRPCCLVISHPICLLHSFDLLTQGVSSSPTNYLLPPTKRYVLIELHQIKLLIKRVSWKNPNNPCSFQYRLFFTNWLEKPYCQRQYLHNLLKIKVELVPTKSLQPWVLAFLVKKGIAYTIKGEKKRQPTHKYFHLYQCPTCKIFYSNGDTIFSD